MPEMSEEEVREIIDAEAQEVANQKMISVSEAKDFILDFIECVGLKAFIEARTTH